MDKAIAIPSECRCSRFRALVVALLALAACTTTTLLHAQATDNLAPRISLAGISESVRSDTLCVTMQAGGDLVFPTLAVADADVGAGLMHARVELEVGIGGASSVLIPGLADLPDVSIIREEPDRIRFDAPLDSVNAAFAALQYQGAGTGDTIDLIADDLQIPPLSAEFRLHITAVDDVIATDVVRCRPPPDLRPESDTGQSTEDDITLPGVLLFDVVGLVTGDLVQLLNDDVPVSEAISPGASMVVADPAPLVGTTALYAVSVNGDAGSAAWSIAIVSPLVFADGFESMAVR